MARMWRSIRPVLAPLLGLAMFWPLLRYASFVMVLYPAIPNGAFPFAHAAFLLVLCAATVIALALWRRPPRTFATTPARRRAGVVLSTVLCSIGCAATIGSQAGVVPPPLTWVAMPIVAWGFVVLFATWAAWCSDGFDLGKVVVMCGSFFLSYVLFSRGGFVGMVDQGRLACVAMPLGSALMWLVGGGAHAVDGASDGGADGELEGRALDIRAAANPFMLLVMAFLVLGAAVRGIVDLRHLDSDGRMGASLVLSAVMLAMAVAYWAVSRTDASLHRTRFRGLVAFEPPVAFALFLLAGLLVVFLISLFAYFVSGQGDGVVVVRSSMELVLWFLLCACVSARGLPSVPTFLLMGMGVEVLSWLLSYVCIPALLHAEEPVLPFSDEMFVLAVMFGLASVGLVASVLALVFSGHRVVADAMGSNLRAPVAAETAQKVPSADDGRACEHGERSCAHDLGAMLTEREAAVATLYAQGHSLAKVADRLGITRSTAQSHIKAVYRKLDVHTRDELIERLAG